ncbi:MAG TPA: hydantoinase/oxoprolinase family protein [Steroidobacteraceae bacterium]
MAHLDRAGAFKVGPQSAGAVPGPAAYGHGGTEPTVTDANIVLGRLDVHNFLGGAMPLDAGAAGRVIDELATRLGMTAPEAAEGVVAVLNANMANAIRARTVQKGIDPRNYSLVAFGGAGPLHGVEVARLLGIPEVLIPPYPGINSAIGLLTTDLKYDIVRTAFLVSAALDLQRMNSELEDMERVLTEQLRADDVDVTQTLFERSADARYVGQGYELRLPLAVGKLATTESQAMLQRFHELHEQEYGHHFEQSPVELVNLRVTAVAKVPRIGAPSPPTGGSLEKARIRSDSAVFRVGNALQTFATTFYDRNRLPVGKPIPGPAIILQTDSTTVVPPDCTAVVEASGAIAIRLGSAAPASN